MASRRYVGRELIMRAALPLLAMVSACPGTEPGVGPPVSSTASSSTGGGVVDCDEAELDDGRVCTLDACENGVPVHTPLTTKTPCAEDGGLWCNDKGNCVECADGSDCVSGVCGTAYVCVSPNCVDGVKNGAETGVDCGGTCGMCACAWSHAFDGADVDHVTLDMGLNGDIYLATRFEGTLDFGGGPITSVGGPDIAIAKFDAAGSHVWSKLIDTPFTKLTPNVDIAVDSAGSVYVTAASSSVAGLPGPLQGVSLIKLDAAGSDVWTKTLGLLADFAQVAVDPTDDVIVAVTSEGPVDFGGGPILTDACSPGGDCGECGALAVGKMHSDGTHVWSLGFGDPHSSSECVAAEDVGVDSAGRVILSGMFNGHLGFGGPVYWGGAAGSALYTAALDADGSFAWIKVVGKLFAPHFGPYDMTLAADPADNVLWSLGFGDEIDYGGGPVGDDSDYWHADIVKLDGWGNHVFSAAVGSHAGPYDVAADSQGNIVTTGDFYAPIDFGTGLISGKGGSDVFIAKRDPSGAALWVRTVGDSAHQYGTSIAVDVSDNVVAAGVFEGTVNFGNGVLQHVGGEPRSIYLAKCPP